MSFTRPCPHPTRRKIAVRKLCPSSPELKGILGLQIVYYDVRSLPVCESAAQQSKNGQNQGFLLPQVIVMIQIRSADRRISLGRGAVDVSEPRQEWEVRGQEGERSGPVVVTCSSNLIYMSRGKSIQALSVRVTPVRVTIRLQ